jgi:hypothetical protein
VDDQPTVAVEEAAEVEERPTDVEAGSIDVPMLMRPQGLLEALPLLSCQPPTSGSCALTFHNCQKILVDTAMGPALLIH